MDIFIIIIAVAIAMVIAALISIQIKVGQICASMQSTNGKLDVVTQELVKIRMQSEGK